MQKIKLILKSILPYGWIIFLNKLRGYSYSEGETVIRGKVDFYRLFLKPGDLVFDVGANYGNRVDPFLRIGCRVVAVEPLPDCVRYLDYKFGRKIDIESICLGPVVGESELYVGKVNVISTLSSKFIDKTVESGRFSKQSWGETIHVKVSTIDELIRKYGAPKFIKIDTEGYELEVLMGLSRPVEFLSFEYTLPEFRQELLDILAMLDQKGPMRINLLSGEAMSFVLKDWMTLAEFKNYLGENAEHLAGWGDIHVNFVKF